MDKQSLRSQNDLKQSLRSQNDLKNPQYYHINSASLGWGERSAKLDEERVELLKKYLSGKKVLDIGCGSGIYVDFLTELGYETSGLDFVPEFIEKASKSKRGNFVLGSAENLPFLDKEFDCVMLFDILEHGDDVKILTEAKRVASKKILVIVPKVVDPELSDSGVVYRHYVDKSHQREYTKENLITLAKKVGLRAVYIQDIHPLYNETIFMALFDGNHLLKKFFRKILFLLLGKKYYPTELFTVFKK